MRQTWYEVAHDEIQPVIVTKETAKYVTVVSRSFGTKDVTYRVKKHGQARQYFRSKKNAYMYLLGKLRNEYTRLAIRVEEIRKHIAEIVECMEKPEYEQ